MIPIGCKIGMFQIHDRAGLCFFFLIVQCINYEEIHRIYATNPWVLYILQIYFQNTTAMILLNILQGGYCCKNNYRSIVAHKIISFSIHC